MNKINVPKDDKECWRPPPLHIPTEVCENIIDMLYSYHTRDTVTNITTLHGCALVCRDWRVRAQKMLFYHVQLADTTSFRRLSTILDNGPHLRDYVHQVELTGYHLHSTTSIFAIFPVVFAGKLPNLTRVQVVHISATAKALFPRKSELPKNKVLPYIPLHPYFPAFLSAFTTVSALCFQRTTFRTFSEFARLLRGLPNLEELECYSVHWIALGCGHPCADITKQPEWASGKDTLPPFAPKLRELQFHNVAMYGAKRLIWTRGPHLTALSLAIPLLRDPKELVDAGVLDLRSCTGLRTMDLLVTSEFSTDTHGGFVGDLLASWKPRHLNAILRLHPWREDETTRQGFADILHGLGMIIEAWLQTLQESPDTGDIMDQQHVKYQLKIEMFEWEVEKQWWLNHLGSCFPTWVKLGLIELTLLAPQESYDKWAHEEPLARLDPVGSQINISKSAEHTCFSGLEWA